ncbi:MAG: SHOCT domain-containing protein [Lamprobacter sp.]|uniref:SHOCT domain-containing protein n=1 Tax=Lamprobacter sp. TaxID=3100796 RepID=UPI002B25B4B0|nr:SHOCT domain-containing protein [Lamprobacter sp.]MEA3643350.1 SHOCT domain-containing protein [Lamprobacter sp.]
MHPIVLRNCVILTLVMLSLAACGGGGAKTNVNATSTTMGQELMDLNASYEQGLISAREYQRAKKDILRKYDN